MAESWHFLGKQHWQNTASRTYTFAQQKWDMLCKASRFLRWMPGYVNPHGDDKPPPLPWTNNQLISFAANLMHEGKANTLRAALMILLHDDIQELVKQEIAKHDARKKSSR